MAAMRKNVIEGETSMMIGTLVNTAAIVAGGLCGWGFGKALKAHMPGYKALWCVNCRKGWKKGDEPVKVENIMFGLGDIGCAGVDIRFDREVITEEFVKTVKDAGFEFHVWTVDDLPNAVEAFRRGAQTVTSNCPKKLLDEYGNTAR